MEINIHITEQYKHLITFVKERLPDLSGYYITNYDINTRFCATKGKWLVPKVISVSYCEWEAIEFIDWWIDPALKINNQ